jgi:hypothetical protein
MYIILVILVIQLDLLIPNLLALVYIQKTFHWHIRLSTKDVEDGEL